MKHLKKINEFFYFPCVSLLTPKGNGYSFRDTAIHSKDYTQIVNAELLKSSDNHNPSAFGYEKNIKNEEDGLPLDDRILMLFSDRQECINSYLQYRKDVDYNSYDDEQ